MKFEKKGLEEWVAKYYKTIIHTYKQLNPDMSFEVFCWYAYSAPITLVEEETGPSCNKKTISVNNAN